MAECAACGNAESNANRRLVWCDAAVCPRCLRRLEHADAVDIAASYHAHWNLANVLEKASAFRDISRKSWQRVLTALGARVGEERPLSPVKYSGLVDDARLFRLYGKRLEGDELATARARAGGGGLYAAFAVAESHVRLLTMSLDSSFFTPSEAVALATTCRSAKRAVHGRSDFWACVALSQRVEMDKKMSTALDWRAAMHLERKKRATAVPATEITLLASSRLRKEAREMLARPPDGVSASPADDSLLKWRATIEGPPRSPFEGARFRLRIDFPYNYPMAPPDVSFLTPVFHPNVDLDSGKICVDLLENDQWSAAASVRVILLSIQSLLVSPTALDSLQPANSVAAVAMRRQSTGDDDDTFAKMTSLSVEVSHTLLPQASSEEREVAAYREAVRAMRARFSDGVRSG